MPYPKFAGFAADFLECCFAGLDGKVCPVIDPAFRGSVTMQHPTAKLVARQWGDNNLILPNKTALAAAPTDEYGSKKSCNIPSTYSALVLDAWY